MILISHRGNTDGKNSEYENNPIYVNKALDKDFDVEVDVWLIDNRWYLGHDSPKHEITISYLTQTINENDDDKKLSNLSEKNENIKKLQEIYADNYSKNHKLHST